MCHEHCAVSVVVLDVVPSLSTTLLSTSEDFSEKPPNGPSLLFRLSNQFRFWLYFLEVLCWQVFEFVSFFVYGCFGFWNLHRLFDGGVCVPGRSRTQTYSCSALWSTWYQ